MDQADTSVTGALMLFLAVCAAIFTAWVVIGPGDVWLAAVIERLQVTLQAITEWYQKTVDGPSKLIAPAITIASGSYAIYKGYIYAESRLHYRLSDFLAREEQRLADARKQLRLIIERPNVDRYFRKPVFLEQPLKNAVRELGWGSYFLGPQLGYVSFQLDTSITQLERRVKASKDHHTYLEHQLATAHLLKGAMHVADASKVRRQNGDDRPMVSSALNHFQSALAVNRKDCEALEYAAHMHVCLKQDRDAERLLGELLDLTSQEAKSLTRARAYRYKSDLEAFRGMTGRAKDAAKDALSVLPNLHGEDRIEEAELQEVAGDRQIALRAHLQARSHWDIAKALYDEVKTPAAIAGTARVAAKLAELDKLPDKDSDEDE